MKKTLLFLCLCFSSSVISLPNTPLFIAHRGGILPNIPENSLMAFQHSMDTSVAMIETDIRLSKDNKMVLFHDSSLLRMTGKAEKLSSLTLSELQQLSLGKEQKIPTLEQALSVLEAGKIQLLLDMKAGPTLDYENLYQLLQKYNMKDRVYIGVRSLKELKRCKSLDPKVKVLGFIPAPEQANDFILYGANAIRLWPKWLQQAPSLVKDLAQKNIPIWMTVGVMDTDNIKVLIQQGASGFIHDNPQKIAIDYLKSNTNNHK